MDTASFGEIYLANRVLNHNIVNFTGRLILSCLRNAYMLYNPGFQEPKAKIPDGNEYNDSNHDISTIPCPASSRLSSRFLMLCRTWFSTLEA